MKKHFSLLTVAAVGGLIFFPDQTRSAARSLADGATNVLAGATATMVHRVDSKLAEQERGYDEPFRYERERSDYHRYYDDRQPDRLVSWYRDDRGRVCYH